jgi:hypothetical protein
MKRGANREKKDKGRKRKEKKVELKIHKLGSKNSTQERA